jgi:hypothetical protein
MLDIQERANYETEDNRYRVTAYRLADNNGNEDTGEEMVIIAIN